MPAKMQILVSQTDTAVKMKKFKKSRINDAYIGQGLVFLCQSSFTAIQWLCCALWYTQPKSTGKINAFWNKCVVFFVEIETYQIYS